MFVGASVSIRYPVRPNPEAWVIPEGPVPESTAHDAAVLRIYLLSIAWAQGRPGRVRAARNLAVRWLEQYPRTGIDPDVCVLDPAPEAFDDDLSSLCLWKPGHVPPRFCVEVVSASHPYKDYTAIQERYAALGTPELLVFDGLLYGPRSLGGPAPLQLWRRDATGTFERVHFGSDPVFSQQLEAWLMVEGRDLVIAEDRAGTRRWLTEAERLQATAERERAAAERERAAAEHERAAAEHERQLRADVERRLQELLAKRG
ncbi:MAG TPA: Uma2 family endonuclease [Polyangiaceae bacterium]|nr:Uma2 family endonuclease [Polyangiaceae bacterium]